MCVPPFGLGVTVQLVPFHDSIKVRKPRPLELKPTAAQATELVQETPSRLLLAVPGLGVVTTDQVDPFQVSASDPAVSDPTAMQKLEVGQETL